MLESAPSKLLAPTALCVGSAVLDHLHYPVELPLEDPLVLVKESRFLLGGCATNVAVCLQRCGVPSTLRARIGVDLPGRFIEGRLKELYVNCDALKRSSVHPSTSTTVLVSGSGQRHFVHSRGCNVADISEDIATALAGTISHVHLGDVFAVEGMFSPRMLSFLRSCQGRGISISMDACWDPTGKWRESLDPFLELVNYLFFNEEEGMHFFGRTTDDSLLSLLSLGPSIVCLKQGAKGARAAVAGRILVAEAAPGLPVVDTTGAGDALVGAFLGSLLRGSSADVALEVGVKVGTLAVFQFGGCSEIPPTLIEKVLADALAEHSKGLKLIESNNG